MSEKKTEKEPEIKQIITNVHTLDELKRRVLSLDQCIFGLGKVIVLAIEELDTLGTNDYCNINEMTYHTGISREKIRNAFTKIKDKYNLNILELEVIS